MRRNPIVYRLVIDSLLAAIYFLLTYFKLNLSGLYITFAILPVIFVSCYFGIFDSLIIVALGEFLYQAVGEYGITVTTPLWILPPLFRAATISLLSHHFEKKDDHLENHVIIYFVSLIIGSLLTSAANTGVIYLDAYLMGYGVTYTIVTTILRFVSTMVTAIVLGAVMIPVLRTLRKARLE